MSPRRHVIISLDTSIYTVSLYKRAFAIDTHGSDQSVAFQSTIRKRDIFFLGLYVYIFSDCSLARSIHVIIRDRWTNNRRARVYAHCTRRISFAFGAHIRFQHCMPFTYTCTYAMAQVETIKIQWYVTRSISCQIRMPNRNYTLYVDALARFIVQTIILWRHMYTLQRYISRELRSSRRHTTI